MSITKSAFVILQNCILLTDGAGFLNPNFSNSNGITTIYILDESYLSTSCLVYYLLKDFSIPRFFLEKNTSQIGVISIGTNEIIAILLLLYEL